MADEGELAASSRTDPGWLSEDAARAKIAETEARLRAARDGILEARAGAQSAEDRARQLRAKAEQMAQGTAQCRAVMQRMLGELLEAIAMHVRNEEEMSVIDPEETLDGLQQFCADREAELLRVNKEIDEALVVDGGLTQSLTALQNRCQKEEPEEYDKAEQSKGEILRKWDAERRNLERTIDQLNERHRELHYHVNRGTNVKQAWGLKRGQNPMDSESARTASLWREGGSAWDEDTGMTLKAQNDLRILGDKKEETIIEAKRLRGLLQDTTNQRKRLEKQLRSEEEEMSRQLADVSRERSELGHERTQLAEVCSDFSSLIERLEEQCYQHTPSAPPGVHRGSSVPPLATSFTIGHGRLSPRPMMAGSPRPPRGQNQASPMRSQHTTPRRPVSPRPKSERSSQLAR
eukprot:TRINITY_DN56282_c0_g1_i1.p1 TRINITY_DN56282_c0_g1~~TRINITY_DN56282_c0_g1_i1.p1  ORF type:complete len:442 (+),score=172.59 TRINITY_DN56282_c0_g1_i1:109-1326(+)